MEKTGAAKDPADVAAAFDDPLHGLEGPPGNPLDEAPNVSRIAAQVQALVLATRSGAVSLGPALPVLLRTAARAARESLEAARKGKREPSAAREAADALESFLSGAPATPASVPPGDGPVHFEKVEKRRLEAARSALLAAGPAVSALTRALDEAAALGDAVRGLTTQRLALTAELLASIPEGLAAAARGEPVTSIAGDLAGRFGRLSTLLSEGEESFSRLTTRMRQSGETGIRAAESIGAAVRRLDRVGLADVLHGLRAVADAAARAASREVSTEVDLGVLEIEVALAPLARAAAVQCVRALCARSRTPRKPAATATGKGKPSRKAPATPLLLTVHAEETPGGARVVFRLRGSPGRAAFLQSQLRSLAERLGSHGCALKIERTKGNDSSVSISFPAIQDGRNADPGFLIVKARGVLHAIPSGVVEECVAAEKTGEPYVRGGKKLRSMALGDPARAGSAVVVRKGATERLVIVVDELVGEETLRIAEGKKGSPRAGIRADGSRALIVDLQEKPGAGKANS